jgi:hypothetical protein
MRAGDRQVALYMAEDIYLDNVKPRLSRQDSAGRLKYGQAYADICEGFACVLFAQGDLERAAALAAFNITAARLP